MPGSGDFSCQTKLIALPFAHAHGVKIVAQRLVYEDYTSIIEICSKNKQPRCPRTMQRACSAMLLPRINNHLPLVTVGTPT